MNEFGEASPFYLSKARSALLSDASRNAGQLALLVLPGSFNPVHSQHILALEIAREFIADSGIRVIGGFLVPTDDNYLLQKLGSDGWSFEKRLDLCRLATRESQWIDVAPWAEYGSFRAATRIRQAFESFCLSELQGSFLTAIEVMGSDSAIRILGRTPQERESRGSEMSAPWYRDRAICCLARPGINCTAEVEQIRETISQRAAAMGVKFLLVAGEHVSRLREVSSSEIRRCIAMQRWSEIRDANWLSPRVLDRLRT
ncbi:MAG: hypothetical protein ABL878_19965 [Burkholderiales bacterium]